MLSSLCNNTHGASLSSFITYYEPVYYDTASVVAQLQSSKRAKRSINQKLIKIDFRAHDRLFRLRLHPGASSVFSNDIVLEQTGNKSIDFNFNKIVEGHVEDDNSATAFGVIDKEGHFDGHIHCKDGTFFIEPANRYLSLQDTPFPSVIYRSTHVVHPAKHIHNAYKPSCDKKPWTTNDDSGKSVDAGSQEQQITETRNTYSDGDFSASNLQSVINMQPVLKSHDKLSFEEGLKKLEKDIKQFSVFNKEIHSDVKNTLQQFAPTMDIEKRQPLFESISNSNRFLDGVLKVEMEEPLHTFPTITSATSMNSKIRVQKSKRASGDYYNRKKTTCMLYLQADHLFYEKMGRSEEACIEVMTRHVQSVNSIYRSIDFDMDGKPDNISFMIKRIKVHTQEALEDPTYRFPGNYGVEKFLEIFSEEDYDAFCMAYMFTYRDFEGGTLGLAWTGDLKNAGGVCEKNGHYRGSFKSLNTGIITLMNYGKHVPPAVSHVTMAHEMGHNFGSPHDPEADKSCVPGGTDGNYIMFARATSGDKPNNKRFSPCSLKSISKVLQVKARGPKGCFKEPQQALCGNGVVEEGEECDCGWEEDCAEDCCWPQRTKYSSHQLPCTLRPAKQCSPSQGPCCDKSCSFNVGDLCREDNGCRDQSYCDGTGTFCPSSILKPNKTVCNEEFVCFLGECTGSICLAYGMESCQCNQGVDDSDTKACELCCKEPGENQRCMSSFELNLPPKDVPDMYSKPGTPCNNYKGYCDVFQKCREVDPQGPLLTLRKLLLSDKSIATFKRFIIKYWYTVIFAAIAVIALMATIVKLCGKKTPLLHRKKRRRRTIHHNEQSPDVEIGGSPNLVVHPAAVKSSLPFMPKNFKEEREARKRDREDRKNKRSQYKKTNQKRDKKNSYSKSKPNKGFSEVPGLESDYLGVSERERADQLAEHLSSKLIVNLPPEKGKQEDPQKVNLKPPNQKITEAQVKNNVSEWLSTQHQDAPNEYEENEINIDKQRDTKVNGVKRARSKSQPKQFESPDVDKELANSGKIRRRKENSIARETKEAKDTAKELTIAKLGPFKMSMELKENKNVESKPQNRKKSKVNVDELVHSRPSEKRTRKDYSRSDSKPNDILRDQETHKVESIKKKEKDRIIVSKLAKSDRPVWDKNHIDFIDSSDMRQNIVGDGHNSLDYRLTLNKKNGGKTSGNKFQRSISQPAPPPNANFILNNIAFDRKSDMTNSQNLSNYEKNFDSPTHSGVGTKLKRSNTMLDEVAVLEIITDNSPSQKQRHKKRMKDISEYDNLGFDRSPDLKLKSAENKRQHTLRTLKDQIQLQLKKAGSTTASSVGSLTLNTRGKYEKSSRQKPSDKKTRPLSEQFLKKSSQSTSELFNELDGSGSETDASSENQRQSPPTQVQSLSEESSGCSTRRKNKSNKTINSTESIGTTLAENYNTQFNEENLLDCDLGKMPASVKNKVNNDDIGSDHSDVNTKDIPQFAANPFVKLPPNMLNIPVPKPRTSLDRRSISMVQPNLSPQEIIIDEKGCESDSTLDRPLTEQNSTKLKNRMRRQRRGRDWSVPETEDADQWRCDPEVLSDWDIKDTTDDCQSLGESSIQLNFTEQSDDISIITDGIEKQMLY